MFYRVKLSVKVLLIRALFKLLWNYVKLMILTVVEREETRRYEKRKKRIKREREREGGAGVF